MAGWAEEAGVVGEGQQVLQAAGVAVDPGEALGEVAAVEEALQGFVLDAAMDVPGFARAPTQSPELYFFVGGVREGGSEGLPFHLADYLELINWTGRAVRNDARGAIAEGLLPILERIGITQTAWLALAKDFESTFCTWIGQAEHVERACQRGGQRWARGIRACRRLFPS